MLVHVRVSLSDSGFLVNFRVFAVRGPNPAAIIGEKPIQWSKLILWG